MDTSSLNYFAEAAKDLNFTHTAKRLFISQQNLSHHIARLEEHYGVKLFERKPHLALTYSGQVLLEYATNFQIGEKSLKNVFSDIQKKEQGSLKIGCSPTRTAIALPRIAERFSQEFPNVRLEIYQMNSAEIREKLLSGELDFHIGMELPVLQHPQLKGTPLFHDSLYLMVRRPLLEKYKKGNIDELIGRSQQGVSLKEFIDLPFLDVRTANIYKDAFRYSGCEPNFIVTITYITPNPQTYYENIAASLTTRTVYLHIADNMAEDVLFFPLLPIPNMPLHHLSLIQHKQKYPSHYGQRFIQIAKEYFEELDRLHPMPLPLTAEQ